MHLTIKKAKETMTSRERVVKTFQFEKVDRIPINYLANPAIHQNLINAYGAKDNEHLLQILGVDFRTYGLPYTGPLLFPEKEGLSVDPVYGSYTRWVEHPAGGYHDFTDFPLQDVDPEVIYNYPMVDPDDFDYSGVDRAIAQYEDYALYCGSAGYPDIINSMGRIMGMEDILINLALEDEATLDLLNRKIDMEIAMLERVLERAGGRIDFMWMGEDLGTQIAPMISLDLFRKYFRPIHQRFIDLADAYNIPTMIHTCGSSSWAYEDFIEMGMRGVDTLQPEAANMSPEYLVEHFAGRLVFHGSISTTGPLTYGTPEEVYQVVEDTIATYRPTHSYMLAPSHMIQDNTPVENVHAMYQSAHDHGSYL